MANAPAPKARPDRSAPHVPSTPASQDIRVTKTPLFRERYKLKVFVEGFNVFNIANLGGISNSLNNPAAFRVPTSRAGPGKALGSGGPRHFSWGSRFSF